MFHESIAASYERQHALFKRLVSLAFSLAGIYWLVMYGMEFGGLLQVEDMQVLRSGQSIIYFVLLTLWGIEYLRETRRMKAVWVVANERAVPPQAVTAADIANKAGSFAVVRPVAFGSGGLVMILINTGGLVVSYVLIILQYLRLFRLAD